MRVKFRVGIYAGGRRVRKDELKGDDPLTLALRYVKEFKYLEALKWLQLAPETRERYELTALLLEALGQEEEAEEFYERAAELPRCSPYEFKKELPST
ncbi:MAG: hypothetical protein GXO03_05605 [Aquificae bacterium]|nr:hypothetical protein [Aquificota bacterium]